MTRLTPSCGKLVHSHSFGLTFELRRDQRQGARPGPVKMYRVPPARAWWPAVGPRLERRVRRHWRGVMISLAIWVSLRCPADEPAAGHCHPDVLVSAPKVVEVLSRRWLVRNSFWPPPRLEWHFRKSRWKRRFATCWEMKLNTDRHFSGPDSCIGVQVVAFVDPCCTFWKPARKPAAVERASALGHRVGVVADFHCFGAGSKAYRSYQN